MFPPFYALLDTRLITTPAPQLAEALARAGVKLIQYRDKQASSRRLYEACAELMKRLWGLEVRLIVNDRADLASLVNAGGVHVGQEDIGVEEARRICGKDCWVGVSTHALEQVRAADSTSADYIAVGPLFATATKEKPEPVVGAEFVRRARQLTRKPLVAIGGITLERAEEAYRVGADSVAVARDLLVAENVSARAVEYLKLAERCRGRRGTL